MTAQSEPRPIPRRGEARLLSGSACRYPEPTASPYRKRQGDSILGGRPCRGGILRCWRKGSVRSHPIPAMRRRSALARQGADAACGTFPWSVAKTNGCNVA